MKNEKEDDYFSKLRDAKMFARHIIKSPYKCPMLKSGIYTGNGGKLVLIKNVYETSDVSLT